MAEIINLGQRRKAAARAASKRQADANAAKFGRSKAEKLRETAEKTKAEAALEGKRLPPEAPAEDEIG